MAENKFRQVRNVLGVPMIELAIKSRVSTATLVGIEKYGYTPGPGVRAKLAAALGVSESKLWPELQKAESGGK
jgi:DNA-binding XRE family transcriptional regulator